jgi:hypothetical protein
MPDQRDRHPGVRLVDVQVNHSREWDLPVGFANQQDAFADGYEVQEVERARMLYADVQVGTIKFSPDI